MVVFLSFVFLCVSTDLMSFLEPLQDWFPLKANAVHCEKVSVLRDTSLGGYELLEEPFKPTGTPTQTWNPAAREAPASSSRRGSQQAQHSPTLQA